MSEDSQTCAAKTTAGKPCSATALPGGRYCLFHDPEHAERCAEGRRHGGVHRNQTRSCLDPDAPDVVIHGAKDVCTLIVTTINDVRKGRIDPKIANTIGFLAGVAIKAFEVGELEARLNELESAVSRTRPSSDEAPWTEIIK